MKFSPGWTFLFLLRIIIGYMNLADKLQLAYFKLKSAKQVLIVGHTSPDADALASVGAMIEVSEQLGLKSYGYADRKIAGIFDFIPRATEISAEPPVDLLTFDVIVILDCGSISRTALQDRLQTMLRLDDEGKLAKRPYIIELDHHELQQTYADLEIRLPDKASTTEIIFHFLKTNNHPITKALADCILIGLMTDTGHFLHANSSREALAVASEMLLRGASMPNIISNTVSNKSYVSLKIWGRALENMSVNKETGLATAALTEADLKEIFDLSDDGPDIDIFGDIVSFISRLEGVTVGLLLREDEGRVKGSLRTVREDIDVSKIAQNWEGGGHKKAAGFSLPGRLVKTGTGWKVVKDR